MYMKRNLICKFIFKKCNYYTNVTEFCLFSFHMYSNLNNNSNTYFIHGYILIFQIYIYIFLSRYAMHEITNKSL